MSCPYNLSSGPWYWSVQNASPGTQVWSGAAGAYVALADGTYVAWLAEGCAASPIDTDINLWAAISDISRGRRLAGFGGGFETVSTTPVTLSNPLSAFIVLDASASGLTVTFPKMNLPTSLPFGNSVVMHNTSNVVTGNSAIIKNQSGTTIATILPGQVYTFYNTDFSTPDGVFKISRSSSPTQPTLIAAGGTSSSTASGARTFLGVAEKKGTPAFVIGAEAGDVINVGIQLTDSAGADLAVRCSIYAYLSDDANGDSVVATAPSGSVVIGTDGLLIDAGTTKKEFHLTSELDGDIDINITEAGVKTLYLILVMPDGRLVSSGAITFA